MQGVRRNPQNARDSVSLVISLLFDQNLSPALKWALRDLYPRTIHAQDLDLDERADLVIWRYARAQGYVIVTKDRDFVKISQERKHPPKVIRLTCGNCPTSEVTTLLRERYEDLLAFYQDDSTPFIEIG